MPAAIEILSIWTEPVARDGRARGLGSGLDALRRHHRSARPRRVGARILPRGRRRAPGGRRELVRGGGLRNLVRNEPADGLSLAPGRRTRTVRGHHHVSNFDGRGPAPVGSYGGLGPYGTYDMAGNVREWCLNAAEAHATTSAAPGRTRPTCSMEWRSPIPSTGRSRTASGP